MSSLRVIHRRNRRQLTNWRQQAGFSLVEVLIAFFVLAIGLLGLAGLQLKAMQFNQSAFQRSMAMVSASDLLDSMRLTRTDATGNSYDMAWGNSYSGGGSGLVAAKMNEWVANIASSYPEGEGMVNCDVNQICTVGIRWRDRFSASAADWETVTISSQM